MDRHLSLSQAARLIGVKRGDIQKKIQENKLVVMEGTVVLSDLKKAFPDAVYEDNTMVEKMEKFMQDAVHKMAQSERDGAQLDALSRRLVVLNNELAKERYTNKNLTDTIDSIKQILKSPIKNNDKLVLLDKIEHLVNPIDEQPNKAPIQQIEQQIEQQIKQFMLPHVRLLPSRHDFISDKSETLLESALRSGLAIDYGCNNGKCGKCKAKLLSGEVEQTKHQDFVLPAHEKNQGYILTCSNRAKTDVTLETKEADSVEDIPLQSIKSKVKQVKIINDQTIILTLKTPRSQRLRFLAGQHIELNLDNHLRDNQQSINAEFSIASCPCEPNNLEFHIPLSNDKPFSQAVFQHLKNNETVTLNGPSGEFILNEDSPNSLIFIAWDTGFSAIKSLIEHAISLEKADHIHLYWLASSEQNFYLENLCRSWNDALDNFNYHKIICKQQSEEIAHNISSQLQTLNNKQQTLNNFDIYLCIPDGLFPIIKPLAIEQGINEQNIYIEEDYY